jgi:hypothetical protein
MYVASGDSFLKHRKPNDWALAGAARVELAQPLRPLLRHLPVGRPVAAEHVCVPDDGLGGGKDAHEVGVLATECGRRPASSAAAG